MFYSKKQIWCLIVLLHYMLPGFLIVWMLLIPSSKGWLLLEMIILTGLFLIGLARAGFWEFTTCIMKYVWYGIYIFGVGLKLSQTHFRMDFSGYPSISEIAIGLVLLIILVENIKMFFACLHQKEEIELVFPLKNGNYMISDGGNGRISYLMNYHYKAGVHGSNSTNASMCYAVDIVKLGSKQRCAKFIFRSQNEDYEIFEEPLYAPISGTVVSIENEIQDNKAFPRKLSYNIGNHVTIRKDDYYVVLGHFRKGSIVVKIGDNVKEGQLLGKVGNSGFTPRPHLHMQVSRSSDGNYWGAQGVPIVFKGKVPYKNRRFHV